MELQQRGDGESRVPRHLDGQPRHPAAGQRALDRLHPAESAVHTAHDERLRSNPGDSGVRPRSGRDAQSKHLYGQDYARARRRSGRQLTPAGLDSAQLSRLRTEQRHDGQELPADDYQPAGRRPGVVQTVRAVDDARRAGAAPVDRGTDGVRAIDGSLCADQRQRHRDCRARRRASHGRTTGHDRPQSGSDEPRSGESRPREPGSRESGP